MPVYHPIRRWPQAARNRVLERLLDLRDLLKSQVGRHRADDTLLLATWNLRNFDSDRFGHGHRLPESFCYIAEIISFFDLVAVQEVDRNLKGLERLMRQLGGTWTYIVTDTTEGRSGNGERLAFLYDRRKISFRNMAGEVVLQEGQQVVSLSKAAEEGDPPESKTLQFARSPFVAAFQCGWFKFNLCTVHIYYGDDRGFKFERRVDEIRKIASFFRRRQTKEREDYVLLGDFNIVDQGDATMQALLAGGFEIPAEMGRQATNLARDKFYDQIAFRVRNNELEIVDSGIIDFFQRVYRDNDPDFRAYFDAMPAEKRDAGGNGQPVDEAAQRRYYARTWRTYQMSDHLLLWTALRIDFTDDYLRSLAPAGG